MALQKFVVVEGKSIKRLPLFDGPNYPYWSTKMPIYIRVIDYEMWDVIVDGPYIPSTMNVVTNERISKPRVEWTKIRNKNKSNKKKVIICFECKKLGHFISKYPLLKKETPKKNRKSKKAMVAATWSNSDASSSEVDEGKVDERANLCLMAKDDESEVSSILCDISIDEFQEEYECLYDKFEKLASKYKALKRKITSLENDLEKIKYYFNSVFEQRNLLQTELKHSRIDFELLKLELENKNEALQKAIDENIALKGLTEEIQPLGEILMVSHLGVMYVAK
ncbi:Uncharacterized protein TCM_040032 [Theobroma cacao]|uniref:DUF4219 domain-containing protein n=1 Tax=Theobroma cacao TaxID=3641 RepID=A0A061GYQ8_THECC|nr:Uncharacterized protein TCM_040032 [Theobroma cacao]